MAHRSARGASIGLRVRVRLRRWRLDRELADGLLGESTPAQALRARQLADPRNARALACSLRELVDRVEHPGEPPFDAHVPLACDAVRTWREGLLGIAERLEDPVAAGPCGIARVMTLLTDGAGPLYNPASECAIADAIWWVADGLQHCPPHTWECPVVIKLDPAHVAWTCARCGTTATTDDAAVRPA